MSDAGAAGLAPQIEAEAASYSQLVAASTIEVDLGQKSRRGISPRAAVAAWILVTLSALSLWGFVYGRVFSTVEERRSQHQLAASLREQLANATSPIGGVIRPGAPIAVLAAPSIGLGRQVVVEGTTAGTLEHGPGHRRDTPVPGQPGVSVLMGRSVLFGAPFAHVDKLRPGASLTVVTGQGTFRYWVERVRRAGDRLPAPLAPGASRLTLVTSEGAGSWTGSWSRHTVYVDASLVGKAQLPPAGPRVRSIARSETALAGEQHSLLILVGWLLLTTLAIAAAAWAQVHWGLRQTVLVAAPVLLACVWLVTGTAARLLPNLL